MKNLIKLTGFTAIAAVVVCVFALFVTGCGNDDDNKEKSPEDLPIAERWSKSVDPSSKATLNYSVDADGVCKVVVGGTAEINEANNWNAWKAQVRYLYTAKANTSYAFKFEAWTETGTRDHLDFQYYNDIVEGVYKDSEVKLTTKLDTITVIGDVIKGGSRYLYFNCANEIGTFYIKMISIDEYTPHIEYELIDETDNPNNGTYRVKSAKGMSGSLVIPATYNSKSVTEIGRLSFENTGATSIIISEGINTIGGWAFNWSGSLNSVTIPASVKTIQAGAFQGCVGIDIITIPATIEFLGPWTFNNWTSSQTIIIKGHTDRQSTIDAKWDDNWDKGQETVDSCDADIQYQGN